MQIFHGKNRFDNTPVPIQQTFLEFAQGFLSPDKIAMSAIGYSILSKPERLDIKDTRYCIAAILKENSRKNNAAIGINFLAIDIEDQPFDIRKLQATPYEYIIHSTTSHTDLNPRYHLFINCENVAVGQYSAALYQAGEEIGITINKESLVPVQAFFYPKQLSDVVYRYEYREGKPFHLTKIVQVVETRSEEQASLYQEPPLKITNKQVKEILGHIDPDIVYQDWIKVASAIKHQYQEEDGKGFEIFRDWSSKGQKFDKEQTCEDLWSRLEPYPAGRRPVTFAHPLKLAKEQGYNLSKTNKLEKPAELKIPKKDLNPTWLKTLVWVTSESVYYNWLTRQKVSLNSVNPTFNACLPKGIDCTAQTFLSKYANIDRVDDFIYLPSNNLSYPPVQTLERKRYINTYQPPVFETFYKEDIEFVEKTIRDHLAWLFRKDRAAREVIMCFIAWVIQNPARRLKWCLVIQGITGCGKSVLADLMTSMLGIRNVNKITPHVIATPYNSWATGKQVIFIEEVQASGQSRYEIMDRLKTMITQEEISVHRKHENVGDNIPNVTNYIVLTEHRTAIPATGNRRYCLLWSSVPDRTTINNRMDRGGFDNMYEIIKPKYAGAAYAFFKNYRIPKWFSYERVPDTKYSNHLEPLNYTDIHYIINDICENYNNPYVNNCYVSLGELRSMIDRFYPKYQYTIKGITSQLMEMGYLKYPIRPVLPPDGGRHTLYVHESIPDTVKPKDLESYRKSENIL